MRVLLTPVVGGAPVQLLTLFPIRATLHTPPPPVFKARGTQVFNSVMSRPSEIVGGSISSLLPIKCLLDSQSAATFIINMLLPFVITAIAAIVLIPKTLAERALRTRRAGADAKVPIFKGKFNIPRVLARWRVVRQPMTPSDDAAWRAPFRGTSRLAGVAVFALFSLYPTLVASIASIFNCSALVDGKRYLLADLTVVCFEGGHIALVFFACIGGAVYAVGIPIAVAVATALKTPVVCRVAPDAATRVRPWTRPRCVCARRERDKYMTADVRARFGFLFHGYSIDRSGAIVAWEAIVMLRKLAVTLVGSAISDVRVLRVLRRCSARRRRSSHTTRLLTPTPLFSSHNSRTSRSSARSSYWWHQPLRRRTLHRTRSTSSTRSTSEASSSSSSRRFFQ